MNWKIKFIILIIIAIPAFTGYPISSFNSDIVLGITYGSVCYLIVVHAIILLVTGRQFYSNIIALAALISLPVVYVGAGVSFLLFILIPSNAASPSVYSPHYVSLSITMLTVIPLALSLVAVIPFQDFELSLMTTRTGVSKLEKFILMFLRVFNHIVYFVIPNIVETLMEEAQGRKWADMALKSGSKSSVYARIIFLRKKINGIIKNMIQLGVEGICASIQYIPLWAVEISQLPDKSNKIAKR